MTYHHLGWHVEAEEQLRTALELGRASRGAEDPEMLEALLWLTDTLLLLDRVDECMPLARESLELHRRTYGATHEKTLGAVCILGWAVGRGSTEAEIILREGLDTARESQGDDAWITFELNFALGNNLMNQSKLADAERHARWGVDWLRRTGKGDPVDEGRTLTELAFILGLRGHYDESESFGREALDILVASVGVVSPHTNVSLYTIGLNLQWMGRLDEAEEYFQRYRSSWDVAGDQWTSEPAHADFLLARVRLLQGEMAPDEALPVVMNYVREEPSELFADMAHTTHAMCLVRLKRFEEAERQAEQIEGAFMDAIAPDHYERQLYFQMLTELHDGLDQSAQAAEYRALLREAESADEASE